MIVVVRMMALWQDHRAWRAGQKAKPDLPGAALCRQIPAEHGESVKMHGFRLDGRVAPIAGSGRAIAACFAAGSYVTGQAIHVNRGIGMY
jgi:hypothetical protein